MIRDKVCMTRNRKLVHLFCTWRSPIPLPRVTLRFYPTTWPVYCLILNSLPLLDVPSYKALRKPACSSPALRIYLPNSNLDKYTEIRVEEAEDIQHDGYRLRRHDGAQRLRTTVTSSWQGKSILVLIHTRQGHVY
jgi:hypothetical protein